MPTDATPVVYIAGCGHSGSTLLALLLDSHPEIACVGETAVKPKIRRRGDSASATCSCGRTIGECPFWTAVFAQARVLGEDLGPERWANDYRFEQPLAQRALNRLCNTTRGRDLVRWAADHVPGYRGRVAAIDTANVAFIRAILHAQGARVFADTSKRTPRLVHMLRVPELDMKLLHLVRDVRGYAASAKKRGMSPVDAARTWYRDQTTIADVARAYPQVPFHRVRYEEMCADPVTTLRNVYAFCGVSRIDPPTAVDATAHHVLGNNMRMGGAIRVRVDDSWKTRLDAEELRQVLAIAGSLNRELGFG
ncbi:sulfotransferase [Luteitalea sp. TBR-22]|uniref:sulfotransferase family protein n=1 Tax=Luteitalea sp. TBR-22 TaxID=2802971 RepID=UPI001EF5C462|nr:sulfotransferase [Luteitalea sp. TBR-22]